MTETPTSPQELEAQQEAAAEQKGEDKPADAPAEEAPADEVEEPSIAGGAKQEGEEKPAEGEEKQDDKPVEEKAEGPPEAYELTPPEGLEITPEIAAEVTPVFQEIGLTNEQANKLMPLAEGLVNRVLTGQADAFAAQKADWAKEAKADPDIGGANFKETEHLVAKALDAAGATEGTPFRKLLDESGIGNHPEMLRLLRFYGKSISEDPNFARADSGAAITKSREEILYGTKENAG